MAATGRTDPAADRVVALTLKIGAYTAFSLIAAGMLMQIWLPMGKRVASAGLLVLLCTPVVRIVVAGLQYAHERDWKYVVVSAVVLGVMILAYALGIKV
jgi:uncharacterized membrane protein